jgi:anti-sigma factor RsiW
MFSLGYMLRIVMISPPTPETSMSMAGPCSDWELVLHAYFDGELDKADSRACELHLEGCQPCSRELRNLKSMRKKLRRSTVGWVAPDALRNRIG